MDAAEHWYDMNLLRVFIAVYEARNVTKAARRLHISQPSTSYSLGKLRELFTDELFLRGPGGVTPTPLAVEVYPRIKQTVRAMDEVVRGGPAFQPRVSTRRFRVMLADLGSMVLLPLIICRAQIDAPGVRFEVVPLDTDSMMEQLVSGAVDAAICIPLREEPNLLRELLMDMPYRGICAKNHPRLGSRPSLHSLRAEQYALVTRSLGHEHAGDRLVELGLGDEPVVALPHFAALSQIVAETDYYSVVPRSLSEVFTAHGMTASFDLPFTVKAGQVALYTHRQPFPSTAIDWLRRVIVEALRVRPYL